MKVRFTDFKMNNNSGPGLPTIVLALDNNGQLWHWDQYKKNWVLMDSPEVEEPKGAAAAKYYNAAPPSFGG